MPSTDTPVVSDATGDTDKVESTADSVLNTINSEERERLRQQYADALYAAQAKVIQEKAVGRKAVVEQQVAEFQVQRRKKVGG